MRVNTSETWNCLDKTAGPQNASSNKHRDITQAEKIWSKVVQSCQALPVQSTKHCVRTFAFWESHSLGGYWAPHGGARSNVMRQRQLRWSDVRDEVCIDAKQRSVLWRLEFCDATTQHRTIFCGVDSGCRLAGGRALSENTRSFLRDRSFRWPGRWFSDCVWAKKETRSI